MNLKNFLKPDWRKIVLSVILLLWYLSSILIAIAEEGGFNSVLHFIAVFGMLIFFPFSLFYIFFPVDIILSILYTYLLSCLIIWVYDKRKKK
jgi:hypothetical protein